jgi:hypothetical protein
VPKPDAADCAVMLLLAELEAAESGAAVTEVNKVVGSVGLSCAIDAEAFVATADGAVDEDAKVVEVAFVDEATTPADFEAFAADEPAAVDDGGAEVWIGAEVSEGATLTGADEGVAPTPIDRRGDEVAPIPAFIRAPELAPTATERSGAELGPIPTPRRGPPEDDAPKTGERRPSAAPPTVPRRPGGAVCHTISHVLRRLYNSLTVAADGGSLALEAAGEFVAVGAAVLSLPPPRTPPNSPPS